MVRFRRKKRNICNPFGNYYTRRSISCPSSPTGDEFQPTGIVLEKVAEILHQSSRHTVSSEADEIKWHRSYSDINSNEMEKGKDIFFSWASQDHTLWTKTVWYHKIVEVISNYVQIFFDLCWWRMTLKLLPTYKMPQTPYSVYNHQRVALHSPFDQHCQLTVPILRSVWSGETMFESFLCKLYGWSDLFPKVSTVLLVPIKMTGGPNTRQSYRCHNCDTRESDQKKRKAVKTVLSCHTLPPLSAPVRFLDWRFYPEIKFHA